MFNVIPFRAARNLMNTSMDDMLSDRFFRNFFDMSDMVGTAGFRVDVKEQPDAYVLEAELPGVKQDDITLTAEDGVLTIAADINSEKKDNREGYLYSERRTGHVERRFSLEGVREDDITAKCEHGILTVTLPKMQDCHCVGRRKDRCAGGREQVNILQTKTGLPHIWAIPFFVVDKRADTA